jgi:HK97 family phage prohead protease
MAELGAESALVDSHDYSSVVRTRLGKLIDARETEGGLWVKFRVFRTRAGDDLIAMLEDEGVDALSIGYTTDDYENVTLNGKSARALKAVSLREISACHWGMAYEAAINHGSLKHRSHADSFTAYPAPGWSAPARLDPARSADLEKRLRDLRIRNTLGRVLARR